MLERSCVQSLEPILARHRKLPWTKMMHISQMARIMGARIVLKSRCFLRMSWKQQHPPTGFVRQRLSLPAPDTHIGGRKDAASGFGHLSFAACGATTSSSNL
ncbi:hypothetical protein ASF70_11930 [Rhizobium sp. Leaf321]|nr:hypothetical protein ASF70_11930 [Rhizobium sp. Leaf321]